MALDHRHHAFLQSLMSRGPQTDQEAKEIFKGLFDLRGNVDDQFLEFLSNYNKELDTFQLEIRASTNQYDGCMHYGLVNKLADDHAKMGTQYSYAQLSYFKALVEAIVQDPSASGKLSGIQAMNVHLDTEPTGKLTMSQKEASLRDFVREKWLDRTDDGCLGLGMRSFLELRTVFKNLDVPFCDVCNEAAINATRCQNEECNVRMHTYCAQRKFERSEAARNCSGCSASWDCSGLDLRQTPVYKAERATSGRGKSRRVS